jgi:hypothetical protein
VLFGWIPDIFAHVTTVGAIVILVIGYLKYDSKNPTPDDMKTGLDLVRAGGVILIAVWAMITAIVMGSYLYRRSIRGEQQVMRTPPSLSISS